MTVFPGKQLKTSKTNFSRPSRPRCQLGTRNCISKLRLFCGERFLVQNYFSYSATLPLSLPLRLQNTMAPFTEAKTNSREKTEFLQPFFKNWYYAQSKYLVNEWRRLNSQQKEVYTATHYTFAQILHTFIKGISYVTIGYSDVYIEVNNIECFLLLCVF